MKKYIIFIFCLFSFYSQFSCGEERTHPKFNEDLITVISEDSLFIFKYHFDFVFVQGKNDYIIRLEPRELREIYNKGKFKMSYKNYIRRALNQELVFDTGSRDFVFQLNPDVTDNYINNDFIDFLEIYCDSWKRKYYELKPFSPEYKFSPENGFYEYQTFESSIFYYAFINNYVSSCDDNLGMCSIYSISLYFEDDGSR